ncbi:GTPase binding protein-like protein Rid1 [Lophiotrema nucula]|uniref:GTPase binding protein-like protein Rid1 n=1 Tax=Lophiotrema nucula TaxID=690887 RepID=A0A6A5ZAY2_9PLEO|nr:GTPase binding protein-like protein Rid1 [Lophiotrema nucula]
MGPPADGQGHRRNKSSSVLKSIIVPKNHKRSPSDGTALNTTQPDSRPQNPRANMQQPVLPLLPPDHPHSKPRAAPRAQNIPINPPSPRKSQDTRPGLHKKTLSSVSLRSLGKGKGKDKDKDKDKEQPKEKQSKDNGLALEETAASGKPPKKTKSSTNLSAMFNKVKSPSKDKASKNAPAAPKDKENTTPPSSATASGPVQTPIWAQFSSQAFQEVTSTTKVPLNDRRSLERRSLEEEIALYTPADYSPSKQRNFFDYGQPSLQKRPTAKERPKSTFIPSTTSATSIFETLTRKKSGDRAPLSPTQGNEGRTKDGGGAKGATTRAMLSRSNSESSKSKEAAAKATKKQNRVMAAVAAFNGKSREAGAGAASPSKLDPKIVDAEFEAVLESRNIPQHQRAAMRTLKLEVKADFVRTHKLDTPQSVSRATSAHSTKVDFNGKKSGKPTLSKTSKSRDGSDGEDGTPLQAAISGASSKRERPRSRTFTFSKGDSPTKKQKADAAADERKSSRPTIPKSPSTRSLVSNGSQRSNKGPKTADPDEYVSYIKKTIKPQDVEIGKLHKLRLLLRNETVEWVDTFLQEGGMTELAGLLHRIMEVEWREDHEDQLLHEVLRCLKGLTTTDTALKQLADMAPTLFPALLAMLFDEEHKGPSDFTTRELLIQLLFAHLSAAPEDQLPSRADELLKYLKDPIKEKESSTVPFILQMHQSRPYQVWCKEITNVTKEVFWIFIHNLNVIPVPPAPEGAPKTYAKTFFPGPRAIVPAAPYVGGVEWDATNYIATHLDLLNGLISSLPSREARNALRSEFKISGFEKLMSHIRACNPKYYGAVHDAVKVWIGAGLEDGWDVKVVRMGAGDGKGPGSPVKSPKKVEKAPQIQAPRMDLQMGLGLDMGFDKEVGARKRVDDDWV